MNEKMKIEHPSVAGRAYELKQTLEFDVTLGEEDIPIRIELFESVESDGHFRALFWERELIRLTPTFPQDDSGGPEHTCDDTLLLERSSILERTYNDFQADSVSDAVRTVLEDYLTRLEKMTGEEGFITSG